MPHLVQLDHDGAALGLGFLGVHFGEALDPGLHTGRRDPEQLGGAVHRQPAQVQQHRLHLDPERHPARRGVGEVQPARLAAVALLAPHEAVLDVALSPTTLAPQRHPFTPSATPSPMNMGNLCGVETLAGLALNLAVCLNCHTSFSNPAMLSRADRKSLSSYLVILHLSHKVSKYFFCSSNVIGGIFLNRISSL